MHELKSCKIGLEFEFGSVQGRYMNLEIQHGDTSFAVAPDSENKAKANIDIELPACLQLKFSGKNHDTDTLIDDSGKIIEDVFIKIIKIDFDGFDVNEKFLHKKITLCTNNGQQIVTSFVGFNGTIDLDFKESNVFRQYLLCNQ